MGKFHWQVQVPPNGPLNREQTWAALEAITQTLDGVLDRAGCRSYSRRDDSDDGALVLPADFE